MMWVQGAQGQALYLVTSLYVWVEPMGGDSERCGLDEESVRATLSAPISQSRIELVVDDPANPYAFPQFRGQTTLQIDVTVLYVESLGSCVAGYDLEIYVRREFPELGPGVFANVVLWDDRGVTLAERSEFAASVEADLLKIAEQLVWDWEHDYGV